MYLLTFTMLIIGVLSIYTQVLAVQTARMFQNQTTIAQTMLYWESAALSLANSIVSPWPAPLPASSGCGLTSSAVAPFPAACTAIGGTTGTGLPNVTVNNPGGNYTYGGTTYPMLATGYTGGTYPWKSIAYQDSGTYYVITYVDPVASGAFITTANGTQIGITQSDLFKQIQNSGLNNINYGYVNSAGLLVTNVNLSGIQVTYPVPPAVLAGSLGIISTTNPCTGC